MLTRHITFHAGTPDSSNRYAAVEIDSRPGLPSITFIGCPDRYAAAVLDLARSAAATIDLPLPAIRVTINVAPARVRRLLPVDRVALCLVLHALVLDGRLTLEQVARLVVQAGIDPAGTIASQFPLDDACEHAIANSMRVLCSDPSVDPAVAVKSLHGLIEAVADTRTARQRAYTSPLTGPTTTRFTLPPTDANTLEVALIAAVGRHHLLVGVPDGFTAVPLLRAVGSFSPTLTDNEGTDVEKVLERASGLPVPPPTIRPWVEPDIAARNAGGMFGSVRPSDHPPLAAVADHGILALHHLQRRDPLREAIAQLLDERAISTGGSAWRRTWPARLQLLATATTPTANTFAAPPLAQVVPPHLVDRFHMQVVLPLDLPPLLADPQDAAVRHAVAINRQRRRYSDRYAGGQTLWNGDAEAPVALFNLDPAAQQQLSFHERAGLLTPRGVKHIAAVARTIADLGDVDHVTTAHIALALALRSNHGNLQAAAA